MPRDVKRAIKLYELSIKEKGDTRAMFNLALLLEFGDEGVEKDLPRAMELYSKATAEGQREAMHNLACRLGYGENGVPRNVPRAAMLFQQAIDAGCKDSLFSLGLLLEKDREGLPSDPKVT